MARLRDAYVQHMHPGLRNALPQHLFPCLHDIAPCTFELVWRGCHCDRCSLWRVVCAHCGQPYQSSVLNALDIGAIAAQWVSLAFSLMYSTWTLLVRGSFLLTLCNMDAVAWVDISSACMLAVLHTCSRVALQMHGHSLRALICVVVCLRVCRCACVSLCMCVCG